MCLLTFAGCAKDRPNDPWNEQALGELVSRIVIPDEVLELDDPIVVDRSNLKSLPNEVARAVTRRLNEHAHGWVADDLTDLEVLSAYNSGDTPSRRKHLAVSIEIEGIGRIRILSYGRTYGPLAGRGAEVRLSWDGTQWQQETIREVMQ
jgi:hypothetical protein